MAQESANQVAQDAGRQYLGTVYAKSLLGAADKAGTTDTVLLEFAAVLDLLKELPKLKGLLESPRVPLEVKLNLLDKALAGRVSPLFLNFLKVTARHERLDCLRAIHRALKHLYNLSRNRVEVQVTTAAAIGPGLLDSITQKLRATLGKDLVLTHEVDPDLLGGMVIRVGDTVYDGSVSHRLQRLRGQALDRVAEEIRISLNRFISEQA